MKIKVDVDCTPQEARAFFGLPDVAPMQEAVMQQLQDRLQQALSSADPEVLMKSWLPAGMQGLEAFQKMFWGATGGGSGGGKSGG